MQGLFERGDADSDGVLSREELAGLTASQSSSRGDSGREGGRGGRLHKGRGTGTAWKWLIDFSAVLMTLVSLTGMVLVFFVPRVRGSGIFVAVTGTVLAVVAYMIWAP